MAAMALSFALTQQAARAEPSAEAAMVTTTDSMAVVVDRAIRTAATIGPDRVLVVFDVDSTLLYDPLGGPDLGDMKDSEPERFRPVERALMYLKSLAPTERPDRTGAVWGAGPARCRRDRHLCPDRAG